MSLPLLLASLLLAGAGLYAASRINVDREGRPDIHYWWIAVGLFGVPSLGGLLAAFAPGIGVKVLHQLMTLAVVVGSAALGLGAVYRLLKPFEEGTGTFVLGMAVALFFAIQLTGQSGLFILAHAPATLALLGLGVRAFESEKALAPWIVGSGVVLLLVIGLPAFLAANLALSPQVGALLVFIAGVLVFAESGRRAMQR